MWAAMATADRTTTTPVVTNHPERARNVICLSSHVSVNQSTPGTSEAGFYRSVTRACNIWQSYDAQIAQIVWARRLQRSDSVQRLCAASAGTGARDHHRQCGVRRRRDAELRVVSA